VEAISDQATARGLATELSGEPRHSDRMSTSVSEWVDPPADQPFVSADAWRRAALHVEGLVDELEGEGTDDDPLRRAGRAMWWRAAMVHALAGELDEADAALSRSTPDDPPRRQIGSAIAALVSGDRAEAQRRIAAASPEVRVTSLLPAELAMPDGDEALRRLSTTTDPSRAEARAWLELALGRRPAPDGPLPARLAALGPRALPQTAQARAATLERLLDRWAVWLAASADSRRAHRYMLWDHRGDVPVHAALPWIHAASQLVDGAAETEVWLDAALAMDRSRFSLRRYAMLRWRSAAWRGDAEAATQWRGRFRALAERSVDPSVAELMAEIGL
jgi:hypothetical protein